ncbi:hypothetical protein NUW58_g473 [Xylaria curta]|uniref:Uncharacterized protein n=1 Tax=Xylaria curta TaxID=42375 RepID=A0ACC1PQW5_9PEZI|nr:hypothetical protein NUW58_g473 [Xylaria curta]
MTRARKVLAEQVVASQGLDKHLSVIIVLYAAWQVGFLLNNYLVVRAREDAPDQILQTSTTRLPTYEDDLEEEDDKMAMGKTQIAHALVEDLDEEDPELDEFNALEADDRLRRLVEFLRKTYNYCFWCKFEYPDDKMEGCPGLTEEDHD